MNFPAELSITRVESNDDSSRPIRIALTVPGSPKERIVIRVALEDFATALTGKSCVPAILTSNSINVREDH